MKTLLKEYRECEHKKTLVTMIALGLVVGSFVAFSATAFVLASFDAPKVLQVGGGGIAGTLWIVWMLRGKW